MRDLMTTTGGREFLTKLIELFRQKPCLWKVNCPDYKEYAKKNQALDEILEWYQIKYPSASRETVQHKLSNIRSAYYKELKKVKYSQAKGADHIHVPKLWYFGHLHFLLDSGRLPLNSKTTTELKEILLVEDGSSGNFKFELQTSNHSSSTPPSSPRFAPFQLEQPNMEVVLEKLSNHEREQPVEEQQQQHVQPMFTIASTTSMGASNSALEAPKLIKPQTLQLHDAYGQHVAEKLRTMQPAMVPYCQKLINEAIFLAEINALNTTTRVVAD